MVNLDIAAVAQTIASQHALISHRHFLWLQGPLNQCMSVCRPCVFCYPCCPEVLASHLYRLSSDDPTWGVTGAPVSAWAVAPQAVRLLRCPCCPTDVSPEGEASLVAVLRMCSLALS
jgi:hypothetical protein